MIAIRRELPMGGRYSGAAGGGGFAGGGGCRGVWGGWGVVMASGVWALMMGTFHSGDLFGIWGWGWCVRGSGWVAVGGSGGLSVGLRIMSKFESSVCVRLTFPGSPCW